MNPSLPIRMASTLLAVLSTLSAIAFASPPTVAWTKQLNSGGRVDSAGSLGIASDCQGSVYVTGWIRRPAYDLPGHVGPPPEFNAFLAKYAQNGTLTWTRELASDGTAEGYGVAADSRGNVYIAGSTWGSLGNSNAGNSDAFLAKYADDGTLAWVRQWGGTRSDECGSVAADRLGNVYVCGQAQGWPAGVGNGGTDAFLAKYDSDGTQLWIRQLTSPGMDLYHSVSVDALGSAYVCGSTQPDVPDAPNETVGIVAVEPSDSLVTKYAADGTQLWTVKPPHRSACDISVDPLGNTYVCGETRTASESGNAFLAKYATDGSLIWTSTWGSTGEDCCTDVSTDAFGNVFTAGYTEGDMTRANAGGFDVFASKHTPDGTLVWTEQWGDATWDMTGGASVDGSGNIYVSGYSMDLAYDSSGFPVFSDQIAFLTKLAEVPEPNVILHLAAGILVILGIQPRRLA